MQAQTKRGRGRPAGSNSFETVSLEYLNKLLPEDSPIQVGRLWFNQVVASNKTPTPTNVVQAPAPQEEQKVEMSLSE